MIEMLLIAGAIVALLYFFSVAHTPDQDLSRASSKASSSSKEQEIQPPITVALREEERRALSKNLAKVQPREKKTELTTTTGLGTTAPDPDDAWTQIWGDHVYPENLRRRAPATVIVSSQEAAGLKMIESPSESVTGQGFQKAEDALKGMLAMSRNTAQKYRLCRNQGILVYGPSGVGKTSFFKNLARRYNLHLLYINASTLLGKMPGEIEEIVRNAFRQAWLKQPAMVFIDEIDVIGNQYGGYNPYGFAIGIILEEMDRFVGYKDVYVVAAARQIEGLDSSLFHPNRFSMRIKIRLPDHKERMNLFRSQILYRPYRGLFEWDEFARLTDGLSPADIKNIVEAVALDASKSGTAITDKALVQEIRKYTKITSRNLDQVWDDVHKLIGLEPVKQFLREVQAVVTANKERRKLGLPPLNQTLHMVFTGNPGTGKTTIARLVGELLAAMGALPRGHLVEADRSSLIAGYIGQTALKTQDVIKKALGGVLFIDEAYSLAQGEQDFGKEAVDTLVKGMEDYRDNLVVIFAGYSEEMKKLLKLNPGLESRIAFVCEFPDYTPEELLAIAHHELQRRAFSADEAFNAALLEHFRNTPTGSLGNGRYARKIVEKAIRHGVTAGRSTLLTLEDVEAAIA